MMQVRWKSHALSKSKPGTTQEWPKSEPDPMDLNNVPSRQHPMLKVNYPTTEPMKLTFHPVISGQKPNPRLGGISTCIPLLSTMPAQHFSRSEERRVGKEC